MSKLATPLLFLSLTAAVVLSFPRAVLAQSGIHAATRGEPGSSAAEDASAEEFLAAAAALPSSTAEPRVRAQFGIAVEVPIWLDVDRDVVRPGGDFEFWISADLGYVVTALRMGGGWTPIDGKKSDVPELEDAERDPLTRIRFSPELRLQLPGKTLLLYLSSSFDANWWRGCGAAGPCDASGFSPGYTGRAGLGVRVGGGVYVDLGLAWSFAGKGESLVRSFWILSPYAGLIFRL